MTMPPPTGSVSGTEAARHSAGPPAAQPARPAPAAPAAPVVPSASAAPPALSETASCRGGSRAAARQCVAVLAGLNCLLLLWLMLRPNGGRGLALGNDLANMLGPLIACWWLLGPRAGGRARDERDGKLARGGTAAWLAQIFFVVSIVAAASGQFLWHGYALLFATPWRASWRGMWLELVYFAAYPFLAGAVVGALSRRRTEAELEHDSLHDALTGLPNRLLFTDRVRQCLERARRNDEYHFAVLFLDLDRFKVINDSLGHEVGDKLLIAAAERLAGCVRGGDSVAKIDATRAARAAHTSVPEGATARPPADRNDVAVAGAASSVARLGGDEFTILLDDLSEPEDAIRVARRMLAELGRPYIVDGHEVFTSGSIGIVNSGPAHATAEDLLRDADAAMYRAKSAGKARYAVFDATMHQAAMARLKLESDLRRAIERDEMLLHYQPIISLDTGGLVGFEALLRWRREGALVSPADFIPVAEDTGLIVPIGEWVVERACRQLADWRSRNPVAAALSMSVNLSRRQIGDARLIPHLERVLAETRVGPASVRLEITESVVMDDIDAAGKTLARIKQTGVELSMDDFGTGYSSLICLHRFPIDVLKIDRGFLAGSSDQRDGAAVIQAIVSLAHNLGMKVVAEGLEKIEQVAFCQALDCDFGQGYIFAKPLTAENAEKFLRVPVPLAATA